MKFFLFPLKYSSPFRYPLSHLLVTMIKFYAFLSLKMVEISRFFTNYGEKIKISFFDRDSMRASRMNTLNRRVFVIR